MRHLLYEVVFNLPLEKTFTYQSSDTNLTHKRVLVPFKKKLQVGFVLKKIPLQEYPYAIKKVNAVLDQEEIIQKDQLAFAKWISYFYLCSLGEALSLFFSFSTIKGKSKANLLVSPTNFREIFIEEKILNKSIILNEEQEEIFKKIKKTLNVFTYYLVFGVTGSGKTILYAKLVYEIIKNQKQTLVLLPEITLVLQIYKIFSTYFIKNKVIFYHGKLNNSKKDKIKATIKNNSSAIVIGTRSAFFLPFANLGGIVLDEEHDSSYKNNQTPRYQLKTLAHYYCQKKNIPLMTFSATPSLETFYYAKQNKIKAFFLSKRFNQKKLPNITFEQTWNNQKIVQAVNKKILEKLENNEQVVIYLNQRGYATSLICQKCNQIFKCINCDVSLTYHQKTNKLICHYCSYTRPFTNTCWSCGFQDIMPVKFGIEKIIADLKSKFRNFTIARFDSDTLTTPSKIEKVIKAFKEKKINILVGTQMIIKGHDFDNIGLVVVFHPEKYLMFPDYKANERLVSHIIQASGRAGRKNVIGEVIVQSQIPENYPLTILPKHSYPLFYEKEISLRKKYLYPPFVRIVRIVFRGKNEKEVVKVAKEKSESLKSYFKEEQIDFIGPSPCLIVKIKDNYRWNVIFKIHNFKEFFKKVAQNKAVLKLTNYSKVYLEVDIDPEDLF